MSALIQNSYAAQGHSAGTQGAPGAVVVEYPCVTTISRGDVLQLTVDDGEFRVQRMGSETSGTEGPVLVGVALNDVVGTSARPVLCSVVTHGPALVAVSDSGDLLKGEWVRPSLRYVQSLAFYVDVALQTVVGQMMEAATDEPIGTLKWIHVAISYNQPLQA